MSNRGGLLGFFVLVVVLVFAFVFGLDVLRTQNVAYGVLSTIGFLVCVIVSIYQGNMGHKNGEALSAWYYAFAIIVSVVFVWLLTRCGTLFGWW